MIISGYVYKFGEKIGNSDLSFDKDAICLWFYEKAICRPTTIFCLPIYPEMYHLYDTADAIGVCRFQIKDDGIYCNMTTLDTPHGRNISSLSDDEIKKNLRFGFQVVYSSGDTKGNKICKMETFEIPYITLTSSNIKNPVEEIERN